MPTDPNDLPPLWSAYQHRVFGERLEAQEQLVYALRHRGHINPNDDLARRLARKLEGCVATPTVRADVAECDCVLLEQRCKSRACVRCSRLRAVALAARALEALSRCEDPRFLTLTLQSSPDPLRAQLKTLTAAFARLRRSPVWKDHVRGGLYVIEVTYNARTGHWHPHIHTIIDGIYFPHPLIRDAWLRATGTSYVVHISRTQRLRTLARYIAKYVSKGCDAAAYPSDRAAELACAMHGLRFCQTFGSLHGIKLSREQPDKYHYEKHVCFLQDLERRALSPSHAVSRLIEALIQRTRRYLRARSQDPNTEPDPNFKPLLRAVRLALRPPPIRAARETTSTGWLPFSTVHAPPIYAADNRRRFC